MKERISRDEGKHKQRSERTDKQRSERKEEQRETKERTSRGIGTASAIRWMGC